MRTATASRQGLPEFYGAPERKSSMKWKCTYTAAEEGRAAADLAALLRRHPGAAVRRDKSKAPRLCVYMTVKDPEGPDKPEKTLDPPLHPVV